GARSFCHYTISSIHLVRTNTGADTNGEITSMQTLTAEIKGFWLQSCHETSAIGFVCSLKRLFATKGARAQKLHGCISSQHGCGKLRKNPRKVDWSGRRDSNSR